MLVRLPRRITCLVNSYQCRWFYRASHLMICNHKDCGLSYISHPFCLHNSYNGDVFLHVLCNGDHVIF